MSNRSKERWNGGGDDVGSGEDVSSAGSSTERDDPPVVSDELADGSETVPIRTDNSPLPNRYREILREQEQPDHFSEDGSSVDNAPRGVGSPMGSSLSVPDDTASFQVW